MTTGHLPRRGVRVAAITLLGALALSACGATKSESDNALDRIKKAGVLTMATDASYAPNEYKDNGKIVGFDIDLATAIAKRIGVQLKVQDVTFDNIIPALKSGKYDFSMSSFTDTKEREATVDFVTYFSAGTGLMVKAGNPGGLKPDDLSLCGQKVAVEKGTVQEDELKPDGARTAKCKEGGKATPELLAFDAQDQANLALSSGRADAVLADSPVAAWAAKQSGGKFEISGNAYDTAPYGIAVPKETPEVRDAILDALKALIADGTYAQLTKKWGVERGALQTPAVNGALS